MDIFQQVIQIVKRFLDQNNIVPNSNAISEVVSLLLDKNRVFLPHWFRLPASKYIMTITIYCTERIYRFLEN